MSRHQVVRTVTAVTIDPLFEMEEEPVYEEVSDGALTKKEEHAYDDGYSFKQDQVSDKEQTTLKWRDGALAKKEEHVCKDPLEVSDGALSKKEEEHVYDDGYSLKQDQVPNKEQTTLKWRTVVWKMTIMMIGIALLAIIVWFAVWKM